MRVSRSTNGEREAVISDTGEPRKDRPVDNHISIDQRTFERSGASRRRVNVPQRFLHNETVSLANDLRESI